MGMDASKAEPLHMSRILLPKQSLDLFSPNSDDIHE